VFGYIIYGRLKSKRLAKKALLTLEGKSLLRVFIERISLSSRIDKIVFATSDLEEDKPLTELALTEGLETYCGHPEDVALRLYETSKCFGFDCFLTTMIDGPFQFREVIDSTVDKLNDENYDMLCSYRGQPNGTDCYGLRTGALETVVNSKKANDTECWGKYFTDTGIFKWGEINLFEKRPDLKDFRLTIDYPEDYEFCQRLYSDMVSRFGAGFNLDNLVRVLDLEEYKQQLKDVRELSKKWETHFLTSGTEVDKDVSRMRALQSGGRY
jgi:spore coat polysaccharide biosynthesis protein SpsF